MRVTIQRVSEASVTIEGNIKGLLSGNAVLIYIVGDSVHNDTANLKNGDFQFKGKFPEAQKIAVNFTNETFSGAIVFFAGNENITIAADTADLSHPVIKNSVFQNEYETYKECEIICWRNTRESIAK